MDKIAADDSDGSIRKAYSKLGEITCDSKSGYGEVLAAVLDSDRAKTLWVASPLFSLIERPDF